MNPYHIGLIHSKQYLFLKKINPSTFQWFKVNSTFDREEPTSCIASTPSLAVRAAHKMWAADYFSTLRCGFRYSLPERDGVGCNAFFWQMAKSYASSNGQYFDEEVGHLCYVDFAAEEALSIWRKLR